MFDRLGVEGGRLSRSAAADWADWRLRVVEEVRVLGLVCRELADCETEEYGEQTVASVWQYPNPEVRLRLHLRA